MTNGPIHLNFTGRGRTRDKREGTRQATFVDWIDDGGEMIPCSTPYLK